MEAPINAAIIERLEKVVDSLQDNSVKMGQILAVHNEKLDTQDRVDEILFTKIDKLQDLILSETSLIRKGCERDIKLVDNRLRMLEKKMWSIAGAIAFITVTISPIGSRIVTNVLTTTDGPSRITPGTGLGNGSNRF